jgi:hypothetical protein
MTHLTSDELIDAMENMLAPGRQSHLATCEACRQQLAELSAVLSEARQASVPEPSPLFWPHFSERVRVAIDHESAPGGNWPSWLRWQVLAPMGALALVVLALAISMVRTLDVPVYVAEDSSPDVELVEDGWSAVAELVGHIDVETASAAGVIGPGVAERAVLELTAEEQQELTRLLKTELMRAKS